MFILNELIALISLTYIKDTQFHVGIETKSKWLSQGSAGLIWFVPVNNLQPLFARFSQMRLPEHSGTLREQDTIVGQSN